MPAPRFFCPTPLRPLCRLALPADTAHHALRTLRLSEGSAITLFDGRGGEYPAILRLDGTQAQADIARHDPCERELGGHIDLLQGLAAGDKMDWVIEKAVELGVSNLYPVAADRSVLKLAGARLDKRLSRWRAIVIAASEQCGRNRLMQVHAPMPLALCLDAAQGLPLFCHPDATQDLSAALAGGHEALTFAIGPEGGWSPAELVHARQRHAGLVRFGSRTLRTETAGLAMVAAATALMGW